MDRDTITTIKKINKVNLVVEVDRLYVEYGPRNDTPKSPNYYNYGHPDSYYPNYTRGYNPKEISRHPHDVIKFDKQAVQAKSDLDSLLSNYPEWSI